MVSSDLLLSALITEHLLDLLLQSIILNRGVLSQIVTALLPLLVILVILLMLLMLLLSLVVRFVFWSWWLLSRSPLLQPAIITCWH